MADVLLELGERYWALGLPAAARSALARAHAASTTPDAAMRLAELALAQGDAGGARTHAIAAAKRAPGPATRILLGRAQLAAGEVGAARMSLLASLDLARIAPWERARAHLELARAAHATGDAAGAAAQAATAFEAALAAGGGIDRRRPGRGHRDRGRRARPRRRRERDAGRAGHRPRRWVAACTAALLAARQAAGDARVTDAEIDAALAASETGDVSASAGVRLRRLERRARAKASLPRADHAALLAELEALTLASSDDELGASDRARLQFLHASLCEDDPATRDRAEAAYRRGLAFQPGHTGAACRLALLMLERGDQTGALAEIERALRIDSSHGLAWRNAARMLDAQSPSLGVVVGRLLDAANPGAGSATAGVAPRLVTATAEVARHDVLAGVYAHGHRVKNLLGIIGARTRSARKQSEKVEAQADTTDKLRELEKDVTALYEEWALYLRSMQAPTPTVELVPISSLLHEVVVAAQARSQHVSIALDQTAGLPDVRGDRMLLREALLNVVSNAAEACAASSGDVAVRVRAVVAPGGLAAPLIEVVVADTGPGISRAHLGRLFVPGFTTKETGSGVGLAIAERVVAAHHGRITVDSDDSETRHGTTITITLPTDKSGLASLPLWTIAERGGAA